jgi:hypothetical protein
MVVVVVVVVVVLQLLLNTVSLTPADRVVSQAFSSLARSLVCSSRPAGYTGKCYNQDRPAGAGPGDSVVSSYAWVYTWPDAVADDGAAAAAASAQP